MSEYVRALRAKIGTDLLLVPSVAALIRDDDGRVLLVQHVEGRWQLPGGAVEPGERPVEALRRECREEAGVDVQVGDLLNVFGGPEYRATYANGDEIAYVVSVFAAEIVAGELRADLEETQAVAWVDVDEVQRLELHRSTRTTLEQLLRAP